MEPSVSDSQVSCHNFWWVTRVPENQKFGRKNSRGIPADIIVLIGVFFAIVQQFFDIYHREHLALSVFPHCALPQQLTLTLTRR